MKPKLRDYLAIVAAVLAIFLCGYGIGFLFGERKGLRRASSPPPPTSSIANWEARTLAALEGIIELTPQQREAVRAEIEASAGRVRAAREGALESYRRELEALHLRLKPHLRPEQWEALRSGASAKDSP